MDDVTEILMEEETLSQKSKLEEESINTNVDANAHADTNAKSKKEEQNGRIYLISPGDGDRGHIGLLQQIIMSTTTSTTSSNNSRTTSIHFIHPIVKILEQSRVLFGDNR